MSVIERWAYEAGVVLPDQHAHRVDQEYFRRWTPDMAYILGFIAADGCIMRPSDTKGSLEVTLHRRDRQLLEVMRERMRIDRAIFDRDIPQGGKTSRLAVGSIRLVDDLIALGLTPRKSLVLEWPHELPEHLTSQFVLGYFDGDGSAAILRTNNHGHRYERLRIRLVGTYGFLERMADTIMAETGWLGSLYRDKRSANLWTLAYVGRSAEALGAWMYSNATAPLFLERKRQPILRYLDAPRLREHRKGRLTFDDATAIREAWACGDVTQVELARRYGVTASNISAIVRGKSFVRRHLVRQ